MTNPNSKRIKTLGAATLLAAVLVIGGQGTALADSPDARDVANIAQMGPAVSEGLHLYYQGNYRDAEVRFRDALAEMPDNVAARYFLGYTHYRMGEYDQARGAFQDAYSINPEFTPVPPEMAGN